MSGNVRVYIAVVLVVEGDPHEDHELTALVAAVVLNIPGVRGSFLCCFQTLKPKMFSSGLKWASSSIEDVGGATYYSYSYIDTGCGGLDGDLEAGGDNLHTRCNTGVGKLSLVQLRS